MARQIGIDIRSNIVRVAALRSSYGRVILEGLSEVDRGAFDSLQDAVHAAAEPYLQQHEGVSIGLDGVNTFIHRIPLPPAALKRVSEVLPFELEAQVPVDIDELVYDSRVLPREKGDEKVEVLTAAAPIVLVREMAQLIRDALGHEAERIGAGALPLGNLAQLCPEIQSAECVALFDLGEETSDFLILVKGTSVFARTLSIGVSGLPDSANELVSTLRQSVTAWLSTSEHLIERLYLLGAGPASPGMLEYLAAHLGIDVASLPQLRCDLSSLQTGSASGQATAKSVDNPEVDERVLAQVAEYGKAIALALGLRPGARDLNLRQGPLAYQRGFGFLKEKLPLLVGLVSTILLSFVFAAWAESRALTGQNEVLGDALATLSLEILKEETDGAEEVLDLLDASRRIEEDPQPKLDGFDLTVRLAELIPRDIEQNIQELELKKGRVTLRAIVPKAEDAQKIAEELKKEPCFHDIKIVQIARVVKSDRQKYSMEFDVRCDAKKKKKKKPLKPTEEAEEE